MFWWAKRRRRIGAPPQARRASHDTHSQTSYDSRFEGCLCRLTCTSSVVKMGLYVVFYNTTDFLDSRQKCVFVLICYCQPLLRHRVEEKSCSCSRLHDFYKKFYSIYSQNTLGCEIAMENFIKFMPNIYYYIDTITLVAVQSAHTNTQ